MKNIFDEAVVEEAAMYVRDGKKIPEDVLEKALGRKPNAGSADLDTLMEELRDLREYSKRLGMFLDEVVETAG